MWEGLARTALKRHQPCNTLGALSCLRQSWHHSLKQVTASSSPQCAASYSANALLL